MSSKKYNFSKFLGFNEPEDGYTLVEEKLRDLISNNTVQMIYAKLPTSRMKFLVAAYYELGYTQEMLSDILDVQPQTLQEELDLIKMVLMGYKYTPRKFKDDVKTSDVLKIMLTLRGEQ